MFSSESYRISAQLRKERFCIAGDDCHVITRSRTVQAVVRKLNSLNVEFTIKRGSGLAALVYLWPSLSGLVLPVRTVTIQRNGFVHAGSGLAAQCQTFGFLLGVGAKDSVYIVGLDENKRLIARLFDEHCSKYIKRQLEEISNELQCS